MLAFGALESGDTVAPEVVDACGDPPGSTCEWVYDKTGNSVVAPIADWLVARPLTILVIVVAAWVIHRMVNRAIERAGRRLSDPSVQGRLDEFTASAAIGLLDIPPEESDRAVARAATITTILRGVSTTLIAVVAGLLILGEFDINLAPLVAGAGIAGVALGFGAQSMVKDFLAGFFMVVEDQFGVGDTIDVGLAEGDVEYVSLRATRLRDIDGTVWHVPNGEVQRVGNLSQQWSRARLDIGVAYDADLRQAQDTIQAAADTVWQDPDWAERVLEEPEVLGVQELGPDAVAIRMRVKTTPGDQFDVARELQLRVKEAIDAAGIEIPFPQRTVHLRS